MAYISGARMTHEDALELIKAINSLDSSIMCIWLILLSIALLLFGRR
jgi:hypothetical protein